ncbi:MAG TPA: cbb3-type cytochrome c oxidase subunit II [Verrucomicrobiae bacterium]|nr:cbb3-type cytochrome c oxidase subunit II [Verrucomicrobiae bacterium]
MNFGPIIFLVAFFGLCCSWLGLVLTPQIQIGRLQQTNTIPAGVVYPVQRPGLARQGLAVYRANGCQYCHSQQVGQTGTICDVVLTDAGTNETSTLVALRKVRPSFSEAQDRQLLAGLPKTIREGITKEAADAAVKVINASGAKATAWIVPVGPDIAEHWGARRTVAEDFLFDYPVLPGTQRVGPDLANVGMRLPDANWQLRHLYAPRSVVKDSLMPPYRFLFEKRRIGRSPSPDAVNLPPELAPEPGYEIVPNPEGSALVAYLLSLRASEPLFDAPLSVAEATTASTNAPAQATTSTNAPAK